MWAIYNSDSGEYWTGTSWGPIAEAKQADSVRPLLEGMGLCTILRTPTADGHRLESGDLEAVELEEADCGHVEEVTELCWRESARQTYLSPAEHVSSCRACAKAAEAAKESAEAARVDAAIDERREKAS